MNVLFFIPTGGGGAEKVSLNFAKIIKRYGKDVHVVFVESGNKNVMSFISSDISYEVIAAKGHFYRYISILKYIFKYKPEIVFSSLTALSTILIFAKLFNRNIKVITRQCFTPKHGNRTINLVIRSLFKYADVNISQSDEMRDEMIKFYRLSPEKVITIRNPLDIEDIKRKIVGINKAPLDSHHFVAIGRLVHAKDYPTLINAFRIVKKQIADATLKIFGQIGDPYIYDMIIKLIDNFNLKDSVIINGYTNNPYKELLESNCFVLSSITEGLPNVLLEAMYLNVPCAVTRSIPFISDVVKDGENGFTAKVGDSEDVAKAMINALSLYGKIKNDKVEDNTHSLIIKTFSK